MSSLQAAYEKAERHAQKLQADKDEALGKIRDRFHDRLREANQQAADAQKAYLDNQAAQALLDRPDGETTASALGLELPG